MQNNIFEYNAILDVNENNQVLINWKPTVFDLSLECDKQIICQYLQDIQRWDVLLHTTFVRIHWKNTWIDLENLI